VVLSGTSLESIEFRPIGLSNPVPSAFIESASFYIKTTVYENDKINRHQIVSLPGSGTAVFP